MPASPALTRSSRLSAGLVLAAASLASILAVLITPASSRAEAGTGVVSWGDNTFMELGAGYKNALEERPVSTVGLSNVVTVKLGYHFSVALLADGTVRSWGGNALGQLGIKTHLATGIPTSVGLHGVKSISVGGMHTLALLENGTVANWGANEFGQLGNGQLNPIKRTNRLGLPEATMQGSGSPEPVLVPNVQNVVGVAAGGGGEFTLLSNGTVLAWGRNDRGQLGTGRLGPQVCKTEIGLVQCSTNPEPVVLPNGEPLRNVATIAAGTEATYAILTSGHVVAWGNNGRGQLGNGTISMSDAAVEVKNLTNVVSLSAGMPYAVALLSNGRVVGWGGNAFHQLGNQADEACQTEPCIRTPRPIPGLENVSSVSAGRAFTLAVIHGKVWALGDDEPWGQLGIGSLISTGIPKPIEGLPPVASATAGEQHGVAVLQSGSGPVPRFSLTPGGSSLAVSWTVNAPAQALRWRTFNTYAEGGPWSSMVYFHKTCGESTPCRYTLPGLPTVPIEVELLSWVSRELAVTWRAVATP